VSNDLKKRPLRAKTPFNLKMRQEATAKSDIFCNTTGALVGWEIEWNTLEQGILWLKEEMPSALIIKKSPSVTGLVK
jgi:hypothetical protein